MHPSMFRSTSGESATGVRGTKAPAAPAAPAAVAAAAAEATAAWQDPIRSTPQDCTGMLLRGKQPTEPVSETVSVTETRKMPPSVQSCPQRCFFADIELTVRRTGITRLRLMGVVVQVNQRDDVVVVVQQQQHEHHQQHDRNNCTIIITLDDGTALVSIAVPKDMLDRLVSNYTAATTTTATTTTTAATTATPTSAKTTTPTSPYHVLVGQTVECIVVFSQTSRTARTTASTTTSTTTTDTGSEQPQIQLQQYSHHGADTWWFLRADQIVILSTQQRDAAETLRWLEITVRNQWVTVAAAAVTAAETADAIATPGATTTTTTNTESSCSTTASTSTSTILSNNSSFSSPSNMLQDNTNITTANLAATASATASAPSILSFDLGYPLYSKRLLQADDLYHLIVSESTTWERASLMKSSTTTNNSQPLSATAITSSASSSSYSMSLQPHDDGAIGVSVQELVLAYNLEQDYILSLLQELQLSGQIYQNQQGRYLPL